MGDRRRQIANGVPTTYTLDLNACLVQVLADGGGNTYLYGVGRIAQQSATATGYFLPDALGSVRQLADASGNVTLAKRYDPYGNVLNSAGAASSIYGFTGEVTDSYLKLVYLRARWLNPATGLFLSKDTWPPDYTKPQSLNGFAYVMGDPINYTDPSGHMLNPGCQTEGCSGGDGLGDLNYLESRAYYLACQNRTGSNCPDYWGIGAFTVGGLIGSAALPSVIGPTAGAVSSGYGYVSATSLALAAACASNPICAQLILGECPSAAEQAVGGGGGPNAEDIATIEEHLANIGGEAEQAMIERLKQGLWTQWDRTFLEHELAEAESCPRCEPRCKALLNMISFELRTYRP